MWLLVPVALAGKWDGRESDIVASRVVRTSPESLGEALSDTRSLEGLVAEECVEEWTVGAVTQGPGATADIRYNIGAWHRVLTLRVDAVRDGSVDHVHDGPKGFTTRFSWTPADGGHELTIRTYINAPGWPFKGYYFKRVHPAWQECHERMLGRLADL